MADVPEIVRFARLVRSMRAAQKRFFAGDKALGWIEAHRTQGELFPGREVGDGPYHRRRKQGGD